MSLWRLQKCGLRFSGVVLNPKTARLETEYEKRTKKPAASSWQEGFGVSGATHCSRRPGRISVQNFGTKMSDSKVGS